MKAIINKEALNDCLCYDKAKSNLNNVLPIRKG